MITIVNITEKSGKGKYGKGNQLYSLKINETKLIEFEHQFEKGLAKCLYKAYKAVKKFEQLKFNVCDEVVVSSNGNKYVGHIETVIYPKNKNLPLNEDNVSYENILYRVIDLNGNGILCSKRVLKKLEK